MARGKWNTSYRDKAKAQYQADQIAEATTAANTAAQQTAWKQGYAAGYRDAMNAQAAVSGPQGG